MSRILNIISENYDKNELNTESFKNLLIDEEYICDDKLDYCFICDEKKLKIIKRAVNCYAYIAYVFRENSNYRQIHHLGLLCNWLNSNGIPIFQDAEKHPEMSILVCENCEEIVGVNLGKNWIYPYLNY